ncbi:DNA mismatch repair protein MutL [subsurface metagenome]
MVTEEQGERIELEVSSRVLRHISRGIYRTPAAALKELVSNAYDARATEVTINTDYPVFENILVRDNGDGMTKQDFKQFITNIGLTGKVAGDTIKMPNGEKDRQFIGHFGIGLLAIGQLAKKAIITSKKSDSIRGFTAELDFEQFEVKHEREWQRAVIKDEREIENREKDKIKETGADAKLPIGTCWMKDVTFKPEDQREHFTEIELNTIRLDVKKKLSGEIRDERNPDAIKSQRYSGSFEDLLSLLKERDWAIKQGQYPYELLLWELGVYCPVPYREIGLFKKEEPLRDIYELAQQYKFTVKVDGFILTKPFESAFFEDQEYPIERFFMWKDETYMSVDDHPLKVTGYLIFKRQIRPRIMQGILVREGGVAIGSYDTTFLQYPYYEGFKFNQVVGELFTEGLSGAINIDRNSFNETDDRYLALADWFHRKLQTEVFPKIKEISKEVSAKPRAENIELVKSVLSKLAREISSSYKQIDFQELNAEGPLFKVERDKLVINQQHPDGSGSGAKIDKLLFAAALVLKGKLNPGDVEELQAEVKRLKTEVRKSAQSV